eukprot:TRINITY_DN192_c0_g1_i7.p1 TRINITY_DN192_c0_g1~~TRINITY_DN192_c0_g1_i7.p1  ORF type:complete len:406 (+),score=17.63 TRINITY_DN192_c0_g1_i7:711-1928(+)
MTSFHPVRARAVRFSARGTPRHQAHRNKEHTPAPYLPASPGMGKTRLLQVLATPASDSDNDINGRAKRDALAAFEGQEDSQDEERARFCSTFRQAVGVYCTFNSGQEVVSDHSPDSLGDSNVSLAARLYYAYWIDMGQKSFTQFCEPFQWKSICVDDVVQAIRADINNEDRPLVICVDEVMLWGGECDDKGKRTSNLVKAIAELPASHRQVYSVLSSLEPEAVRRGVLGTNRTPVPARLQGLDEQYAHQLISRMLPKPQEPPSFLALLIRDCNGCPRLLEHVSVILCQPHDANSQLESLTVVASKLSNHTTYKTKLRLKTPTVQTHLFQALVLAVRATAVAEETLGDLSHHMCTACRHDHLLRRITSTLAPMRDCYSCTDVSPSSTLDTDHGVYLINIYIQIAWV